MSEIVNSSFEYRPLTPQEQELRDALLCPHIPEQYVEWVQGDIALIVQQQPTQARRELIQAAGRVIEWELFAKPGESLPEGLALLYNPTTGESSVGYPPSSPYTNLWSNSKLYSYITEKATSIAHCQSLYTQPLEGDRVRAAIEGVIRTEERYQFFSSFTIAAPQTTEQPLTWQQRIARHADEADRIMRRSGTTEHDLPFLAGTGVSQSLKRIDPRLDMETMPLQSQQTARTFDRFNAWFISALQIFTQEVAVPFQAEFPKLVAITVENNQLTGITSDNKKIPIYSHVIEQVARKLFPETDPVPLELPVLGRNLASKFINDVYKSTDKDLSRALEEAVRKEAEAVQEGEISNGISEQMLVSLRRPNGQLHETAPVTGMPHDIEDAEARVDTVPPEEEKRLSKISVGTVVYRSLDMPTEPRLILEQKSTKTYPQGAKEFSLIIEFTGSQYAYDTEPYIPGLQVVARKGSKWYFAVTEHDPYQGNDQVLLREHQLRSLQSNCQMIGFTSLEQLLQRHKGELSVAELAEYIMMSTVRPKYRMVPPQNEPTTLGDFTPYIHNGLLVAQCTGSGAFMKAILMRYLPKTDTVTPIRGLVLHFHTDTISKLGHEQTFYTYGGRQYIVDASRPEQLRVGWMQRTIRVGRTALRNYEALQQEKQDPCALEVITSPPTDTPQPMSQETLQAYHVSGITRVRTELEMNLQNIFQAASIDDLYAQLSKLPPQDPNIEVLRLLDQMEKGNAGALEGTLEYLQNYANADESMRHTLRTAYHLPAYESGHLTYLINALTAAKRFMSSATPRDTLGR